jgi:hypothetical protein
MKNKKMNICVVGLFSQYILKIILMTNLNYLIKFCINLSNQNTMKTDVKKKTVIIIDFKTVQWLQNFYIEMEK